MSHEYNFRLCLWSRSFERWKILVIDCAQNRTVTMRRKKNLHRHSVGNASRLQAFCSHKASNFNHERRVLECPFQVGMEGFSPVIA